MQSHANIETERASQYLQQLAKHFGHKVEVDFDETQGRIAFPFGTCRMEARDGELRLVCEAATAEEGERLQNVVGSHLVRFAFREPLYIRWTSEETA